MNYAFKSYEIKCIIVMYVTIMNICIMYTHSFELFSYSVRGPVNLEF